MRKVKCWRTFLVPAVDEITGEEVELSMEEVVWL